MANAITNINSIMPFESCAKKIVASNHLKYTAIDIVESITMHAIAFFSQFHVENIHDLFEDVFFSL